MIEEETTERSERFKLEAIWHADLKCSILNAPWSRHKDKRLYKVEDFLEKDILPKKPNCKISESEKSKRWAAAGAAMMKVVREHEKETGVRV